MHAPITPPRPNGSTTLRMHPPAGAAQNQPGGIVEAGSTARIFEDPQDQRTADYVHGRFG